MNKIKLTGISLETKAGKEVNLTMKEAKDLYDQLHELFGKKIEYVPSAPIYIERDSIWKDCKPYWQPNGPLLNTPGNSGDSIPMPDYTVTCNYNSGLKVNFMGVQDE